MKKEILGHLAKSNANWPDALPVSAATDYPISDEFEGGALLPLRDYKNLEFVVVKRFEGANAPPYQVRFQRIVERLDDDTKYCVILEKMDVPSEHIYGVLLTIWRTYEPHIDQFSNQPTNQN